jgi:hypothetical protein
MHVTAQEVGGLVVLVGQSFRARRGGALNAIDAPPYVGSILQAHLIGFHTSCPDLQTVSFSFKSFLNRFYINFFPFLFH